EPALWEAPAAFHEQDDWVTGNELLDLPAAGGVERHAGLSMHPTARSAGVCRFGACCSTKIGGRAVRSGAELDAAAWDGLTHGASPFLRHGFLRALEESGSIDPITATQRSSGWASLYLLAEQAGRLVGAVPAFVKEHSYGEYIFDWGWASAAQRAGLRYYPKLVIAAPATPATGQRILLAPGADAGAVRAALIAAVRPVADDAEGSSIHWLFCTAGD